MCTLQLYLHCVCMQLWCAILHNVLSLSVPFLSCSLSLSLSLFLSLSHTHTSAHFSLSLLTLSLLSFLSLSVYLSLSLFLSVSVWSFLVFFFSTIHSTPITLEQLQESATPRPPFPSPPIPLASPAHRHTTPPTSVSIN